MRSGGARVGCGGGLLAIGTIVVATSAPRW